MKNREAQGLFKESEILYRERRYEEALDALQRLDAKYPNTRNILYPIAKCLRRLGRFDETASICDRLILEFNDQRALHIRKQVERSIQRANAQTIQVAADVQANIDDEIDAGFDALDLGDLPPLDEEAPTVHLPGGYGGARLVQQSGPPWMYIGIGVAVGVVLLLFAMIAMSGGGDTSGEVAAPVVENQADSTQFKINFYMFGFFSTLVIYCVSLYLTLRFSQKLPYNSFSDDGLLVFGFSILCAVVGYLPCIGIFINIYILRKRFELSFVDFLMLIGISIVVTIPFAAVYFAVFFQPLMEAAQSIEPVPL